MNNSTFKFTTRESSTNFTTYSIGPLNHLEICMYSISFLVGLPTHSYIIWLIITGTGSGIASEFFMLNLSVCEIANALNTFFFVLSIWFSHFLILQMFLTGFSITGRPLFQCLMCVERYLAVLHPVTFLKYKPLRYRVICSIVVWTITLGSCLCSIYVLVSFNNTGYAWFSILLFVFYLAIQLFCLVAVLIALKRSGPGERGRERKQENHMKRRAFNLILITTVNMVMLYVPILISAIFTYLTKVNIQGAWDPSLFCYVMAGFVQPILYLHRSGKLPFFCSL
ncbi:hydroxycarboxylic acid receptor 2-like [Carassius gibelio]|uniref:hydroxycarboxylic acid receptor 2-like n=1 Tax=Carassius gibelio TaxID=101364 RepID=UPI002277DEE2|nr:hydroxycarboxylic acid receptor 2-like [Carassius gibelio]